MAAIVDHLDRVGSVLTGDGWNNYAGQTFVAEGTRLQSITFVADLEEGGSTASYRVLVTTANFASDGFHPGTVLFEAERSLPLAGGYQTVTVDTADLKLESGQTYAFIIDTASDRAPPLDTIDIGLSYSAGLASGSDYARGYAVQALGHSSETRAEHFQGDWVEYSGGASPSMDLSFRLVFTSPGVSIKGTNKNDRVDAAKSVKGQPNPGERDDTISGRGGKDKLSGLGGDDLIDGGKDKDLLTGGEGRDSFRFSASLKQKPDKIVDFSPIDDVLLLKQTKFSNLSKGALSEAAFGDIGEVAGAGVWIQYKANGILAYDRDGEGGKAPVVFAKLVGAPDISAADLVVV